MIRRLIAAFALTFTVSGAASADTRAVYTIKDIPVDERGANVIEAQQRAFTSARIIGAKRLINKITLPEDRQAAGGIQVDAALANRLAAAVDVQEEVRGSGRYRGVLATVINPQAVRPHLQSLGVPFVDRQAPLALIIPVATGQEAWEAAWGDEQPGSLAPTVTSINPYGAAATWEDIQYEVASSKAGRGIVAELLRGFRVRLTLVTAGGTSNLGTTNGAGSYEGAVADVLALLEDQWKRQSIVRSNSRTVTTANVLYTSLPEWSRLRGALARSPLVSEFQMKAITTQGAVVSFAYAGDRGRLTQDLRQRGVSIDSDVGGWTMRSALSGAR